MGLIDDMVTGNKVHDPINIKDFAAGVKTGAGFVNGVRTLHNIINEFVYAIAYMLSLPITVLIHHRFGVRFLSGITVLLGLGVLWGGLFLVSSWNQSWVSYWVILVYLIAVAVHKFQIWRNRKNSVRWHSRSPGIPYAVLHKLPHSDDLFIVEKIHEPLILLILGGVSLLIPGIRGLGMLLICSGLARFVLLNEEEHKFQNKILDQIDQQIESEILKQTIEEKQNPQDTQGFVVPSFVADHPEVFMPDLSKEIVAPKAEDVISSTIAENMNPN